MYVNILPPEPSQKALTLVKFKSTKSCVKDE